MTSFYQAEDYIFSAISKQSLAFEGRAKAYLTGVQVGNLNPVSIHAIDGLEEIIDKSREFYEKNRTPWSVVIPEALLDSQVKDCLQKKGLVFLEKTIAMGHEVKERSSVKCDQIRLMNDNIEAWMAPLREAFQAALEIVDQYRLTLELALKKGANFYNYSFCVNKVPVASLTLTIHENRARIDAVGTLHAHQRKGYASLLINHALDEAKRQAVTHCFLDASVEGVSMYEKFGFRTLFDNHIYGDQT